MKHLELIQMENLQGGVSGSLGWAGFDALIVVGGVAITATIVTGGAAAAFLATTSGLLQASTLTASGLGAIAADCD